MTRLLAIAALLFSLPAQAQMYRCVDPAGRAFFTDKPLPGCKLDPRQPKARAEAVPKGPLARGTPASKKDTGPVFTPEEQRARLASRCRTYQEQLDWLASPAGKSAPNRGAQVAQVNQAMRECR
jgi:streptogramin lyase